MSKAKDPFDQWFILGPTAFLVGLGVVSTYAASALKADILYNDSLYMLKKQAIMAAFGAMLILWLQSVPYQWLKKMVWPIVGLAAVLLACVVIPGVYTKVGGAYRWIRLGPIQYQPSELAKVALIFLFAKSLSRPHLDIHDVKKGLGLHGFILCLFGGLLLLQPDFGTCVLILGVGLSMIYIKGLSHRFLWIFGFLGFIFCVISIAAKPYRWKRLVAFWDPWSHSQDSGFQIIQSYLAIYNGGLLGLGFGESKQKMFYLPEAHTDFILAVIGEELGLLGLLCVCCIFFFLIQAGLTVARQCRDPFGRYLAFGISVLIALQSFFNMGVVLGVLPTKGISLPFVSSGASSLVTFMFLIGILVRVSDAERS